MSDSRVICDLCGTIVAPNAHYVIRIDVFADPSVPAMSSEEELGEDALAKIYDEMKGLTADDMQDDVHRRFEYRVCRACQKKFLANPLGLPRGKRTETN